MTKTITSFAMAQKNILGFDDLLEESDELQNRLGYVRAWYAVQDEDGDWQFGPSKFIGYQGLSADSYVANTYDLDGKVTEKLLQKWFIEIDETHPLYEELQASLSSFLDWYDKRPSSAFRLNIPIEVYEQIAGQSDQIDTNLTDLLIAVAKSLPLPERRRLAEAI